jgi:predicted O-linked N-acetylglucosamine transferase (SPINDLY family)
MQKKSSNLEAQKLSRASQQGKKDLLRAAIERFYAKDFAQAAALFEQVIDQDPRSTEALLGLSMSKFEQGRLREALADAERLGRIDPRSGRAANQIGVVLRAMEQFGGARDAFKRACRLEPGNADFWFNAGAVALQLSLLEDAERSFTKAVSLDASDPGFLQSLGLVRALRGDAVGGVGLLRTALAINPRSAPAWNDLAIALLRSDDVVGALAALQHAVAVDPTYVDAWMNTGVAMSQMNNYRAAADAQRHVVELCKTLDGHLLLVDYLALGGDLPAAREQLALVKATVATNDEGLGILWRDLLLSLLPVYEDQAALIGSRERFAATLEAIEAAVKAGAIGATAGETPAISGFPFYLAAHGEDDKSFNVRLGDLAHQILKPLQPKKDRVPKHRRPKRDRLRIAVVGGMFYKHTVWKILTRGWLENIDRDQFELCGYRVAGIFDDDTQHAGSLLSRFESKQRSLNDWVDLIARDSPDIVLFPELGMEQRTWQIANLRLAPIQCVAWGHPVTSGLPNIDYFLTGAAMEPADGAQHYAETLVTLPNLGIYYRPEYFRDGQDFSSELAWAKQAIGPSADRVFYWSCQTLHKYHPIDDDVYPAIAESVPNAMFGFIVPEVHRVLFERRLQRAFAARGLRYEDFCRLLPSMSGAQFAAVSSLADVYLDSLHWSGGNTTLENLAFDTPMVTAAGRYMRGRHTAAILSIAGLGDWVCGDKQDYIRRAIFLGNLAERMQARQVLGSAKHAVFGDQSAVFALQEFFMKASHRQSEFPKR